MRRSATSHPLPVLLGVLLSLFRPSGAHAEERAAYARFGYELLTKGGQRFTMVTLTKVTNPQTCQSLLHRLEMPSGGWQRTSAECFSSQAYDVLYAPVFDNQAGPAVYLAYVDRHGWQTRVNFGAAPPDVAEELAKAAVESLKASGVREIQAVSPESR